jgi:hypothetical protein
VVSVQFGEPSAHRNVVPELVRHIQDSSIVFDVSGKSALKPACGNALALFTVTFAVHDGLFLCGTGVYVVRAKVP